jgi:GWxTD domain-containing protein
MLKIIALFLTIMAFGANAFAQSQRGTVEMDVIAFVRDSGKIQTEIYYSIIEAALLFEQKGDSWVAPINGRAELWHDGVAVDKQDIKKEKTFTGTKAALDSQLNSLVLSGVVLRGNIRSDDVAALIFQTKNQTGTTVFDTIKRKVVVPAIDKNTFFLGGIELANTLLATGDRSNPFEKVGYIITPNPSKVYTTDNSKLCYYTELYSPPANVSASASVEVITKVLDGQRHEMFSNSHRQVLAATTIPLIGSVDIDGLPSDSYILEVDVKNGSTVVAMMQKSFFYDSGMKLSEDQSDLAATSALDEDIVFSSSDLSRMSRMELEEKGDQSMYVGRNDQAKVWKNLKIKLEADADQEGSVSSDTAKSRVRKQTEEDLMKERRFLFAFWRDKDREQGAKSPFQAYNVYFKHVEEVNRKYTHQKTPGWETDFGRIYLAYGAPDERNIKLELHNIDAKPYIVWQYITNTIHLTSTDRSASEPSQLGINYNYPTFVFVDRQGGGKFVLVHSNVQGEVYDQNWYTEEALQTH